MSLGVCVCVVGEVGRIRRQGGCQLGRRQGGCQLGTAFFEKIFEKIQGLEIGERNDGCNSFYSSSAIHCLQKITFLLHSLMAKHQMKTARLGFPWWRSA